MDIEEYEEISDDEFDEDNDDLLYLREDNNSNDD